MTTAVFSQNDEEACIMRAVADLDTGVVVDIGAYDGLSYSNSRTLIESGWSAILVEPAPDPLAKLDALYGDHPRVKIVNAALAAYAGDIELLIGVGEAHTPGVLAGHFTTTNPREAASVTRRHGIAFESHRCRALDWSALLDLGARDAHVLSIDTEGTSIDRFCEIDLRAMPHLRIACIERSYFANGVPDPAQDARARRHAAASFFAPAHTTCENLLFIRRDASS